MGKNNKFEMNVVDEGFDDNSWQELEREKQKIMEKMKLEETNLNILTKRNIIIFIVWILLYKLFIKLEFGIVYDIILLKL